MRKGKKNKSDNNNFNFNKNKAFENKEIAGIDMGTDYYDDFAPDEAVDYRAFCEYPQEMLIQETEQEGLVEAADSVAAEVPAVQGEPEETEVPALSEEPKEADAPAAIMPELPVVAVESSELLQAEPDVRTSAHLKSSPGLNGLFQSVFTKFYNICYVLGIQSFRYGKRIFIRLGRLFMRPVRYTFALARMFVLGVDRIFFKSVHALREEFFFFRDEIKSSSNFLHRAIKENRMSFGPIMSHYAKKAFKKHKEMFRTALNLGIPAAALLVLWSTVTYWNSETYSLQLTYNGVKIGNIQDESVYIQAQGLVNEQLGTLINAQATPAVNLEDKTRVETTEEETLSEKDNLKKPIEKPIYEIERISLNALSGEATLSDSLIENSAEKLTAACGIFIDGEFIGAVKNESDATGVFENLLAPYKTEDVATNAAFVEDVRFTQGLYPDNVKMMDAIELKDKLSAKKAEAVYHTVQDGETIWSIATAYGLSESDLLRLNPNQGPLIKTGETLKVSNEVNRIRVKLIKTEVRNVEVPFETIKTDNPNLFRGDTRIVRKGEPGNETVTESVTYIDNVRVSVQEIGRNRLSDPIAQKTDVGTKSTKVSGSSGSYTVKVSNVGFVWPVPGYYSVSSPFGYRSRGYHSGVDISGPGINGKVIVAAKDGVVESAAKSSGGLGNNIVINHGGGIKTRYGHCLSGSISVSPGQHVSAGQAIARAGSTGNSTGPHLHFEVLVNGTAVNPLPYIR